MRPHPCVGHLGEGVTLGGQGQQGATEAGNVEKVLLGHARKIQKHARQHHTVCIGFIEERGSLTSAHGGLLDRHIPLFCTLDQVGGGEMGDGRLGLGGVGGEEILVEVLYVSGEGLVASGDRVDPLGLGDESLLHLLSALGGEGTGGDALGHGPMLTL